jgi:hypothetical protein
VCDGEWQRMRLHGRGREDGADGVVGPQARCGGRRRGWDEDEDGDEDEDEDGGKRMAVGGGR